MHTNTCTPTHVHTAHREKLQLEAQKLKRELRTAKRRKERDEDEKAQQDKQELESKYELDEGINKWLSHLIALVEDVDRFWGCLMAKWLNAVLRT